MIECLNARALELIEQITNITAQLQHETDAAARAKLKQIQREARGRASVYAPALALINETDAAREYLERVSGEAVHLLNDMRAPDETLTEAETAAPVVSGFYHETRYALALLGFVPERTQTERR